MYKGSLASRASTPSSSSRFYKVRKGQFRFRLVLPPSPPKLYIVHSRSFIFAIIHAQRFSFFLSPMRARPRCRHGWRRKSQVLRGFALGVQIRVRIRVRKLIYFAKCDCFGEQEGLCLLWVLWNFFMLSILVSFIWGYELKGFCFLYDVYRFCLWLQCQEFRIYFVLGNWIMGLTVVTYLEILMILLCLAFSK